MSSRLIPPNVTEMFFDGFDELVGVFRIDFDVEYVDIRKRF